MGNRNNDELVGFYRNLPNQDGINRFLRHGLTEKETKRIARGHRGSGQECGSCGCEFDPLYKKPLRY